MFHVLIPTYHRPDELALCLAALREHVMTECMLPTFQNATRFWIYDNNSGDDVKAMLRLFQADMPFQCAVCFGDKNIGKAKALNIFTQHIKPDDIVVSLDSDIVIETKDFFTLGKKLLETMDASVIATNQILNCHHRISTPWVECKGYHVKVNATGMGIAGGCFFTTGDNWLSVGGYRDNRGVFGGNDGWFFYDVGLKTRKPIMLVQELVVRHLPESDQQYREWKDKAQQQQVQHNKCLAEKGYFDK